MRRYPGVPVFRESTVPKMALDIKKNHDRIKIKITEESVIFISILKWFILSTAIGMIVGAATAFFLKVLEWTTI